MRRLRPFTYVGEKRDGSREAYPFYAHSQREADEMALAWGKKRRIRMMRRRRTQ